MHALSLYVHLLVGQIIRLLKQSAAWYNIVTS